MFSYSFNPGEPGLFVEVYLPKKADFQGVLYDTLSRGFDTRCLWRHFRGVKSECLEQEVPGESELLKKAGKVDEIKELLQKEYPELVAEYDNLLDWLETDSKQPVKDRKLFFSGFSMYEVDGVFYDQNDQTQSDQGTIRSPNHASRRIAERVQVIRLLFRFDPYRLFNDTAAQTVQRLNSKQPEEKQREAHRYKTLTRMYLQAPLFNDKAEEFLGLFKGEIQKLFGIDNDINQWETVEAEVLKTVNRLILEVRLIALFVFGYFVFEICQVINDRNKKIELVKEQEIWVTSFWNLTINRVTDERRFLH